MFERVLCVCTGNICRSVMAEALLRERLGERTQVGSAGTGALLGHPADEHVRELLSARGIDVRGHRARQVTQTILRWAEIVLVMEREHLQSVYQLDPTVRGRSFLVGHWLGGREIADPYQQGRSAFERTLAELDETMPTWVSRL